MGCLVKTLTFLQGNTKARPNEDCLLCLYDNQIFAVADGVSRSRINGSYPELSSVCAAKQFCDTVVEALRQPTHSMYSAFMVANVAIAELNSSHDITRQTVDYFHNDYLACVGIAGRFSNIYPRRFEYGYIGDCGMFVYDANYVPKFLSEDRIAILEQFREAWGIEDEKERYIYWRYMLRNHPNAPYMTYGALTGEMNALHYLKTGYVDLVSDDTLVLFSDGIYPFIFHQGFRKEIITALKDNENGALARSSLGDYMNGIIPELRLKGAKNLNDDRAFIALKID